MHDFDVIISFVTAFALTYLVIPPTIRVAVSRNLCDEPGERRSHTVRTPRLGGIAIFAGSIFSIMLWVPFDEYGSALQYVLCAYIIIFLIGVKDDIDGISPSKKLIAEVMVSTILFFKADVRIYSLFGILGIEELPGWASLLLTIFTVIVIINSLNLIDGINGLSGSLTLLSMMLFGSWFLMVRRYDLAIIAVSTAGAIIAFLKYNFTPARIFMGDTGALLLGLVCSILTIKFMELNEELPTDHRFRLNAAPGMAISILMLPLFDTLRVFVTRLINGKHPLQADRNHIHHLLLDVGFSHMKATGVLVLLSMLMVLTAWFMQRTTNNTMAIILMVTIIASLFTAGLYASIRKRRQAG
ncbi:MAG: hypothetical protein RLY31_1353 [Bacteroidota bacterium]